MSTNPISMAAWRINAAKNSLIGRGDIPGLAAEDTAPRAGSNAEINKKFSQKRVSVTIKPLLAPNFVPNFGKILRAVSEIIRSGRTHGQQ